MLPSTGYFKGISCPFYDNGLCERPYCHFRHVKKESHNTTNDGIESGAILQKLVSAAVQKVLQQTEASAATIVPQTDSKTNNVGSSAAKVTYNPTPIAELNKINSQDADENSEDASEQRKRHIPVPYTPRKPASLPIQRPIDTNGSSKPFIYIPPPVKYTPGSTENAQCDKYTPTGSTVSTEKYLPGTEAELQEYNPNEGSVSSSSKRNYVPSDKSVSKKKILEYKPTKVNTKSEAPSVTYQPTPRALAPCFSSDEEEPEAKKLKLAADLNGLDDLGPEFDILDQILDEEKSENDKLKNEKSTENQTDNKNSTSNNHDNKKEKSGSDKNHSSSKSHHKSSSDKKHKSSKSEDKSKHDKKSSEVKSKHKSSSRDKDKDSRDKKEKHSSDKKRHSSSKESDSSSKHSKHSSLKKHESEKHSSKHKSKTKDKSDHKKSHKSSKESKSKHKSKENDVNNFSDNDDPIADEELIDEEFDLDSDEDAIALECKRIFDEYVPTEKPKVVEEPVKNESLIEEESLPGKKRISRAVDKNVKVIPKTPLKPDYKIGAAQQMAERLAKVREFHAAKKASAPPTPEPSPIPKNSFTPPISGNTKIRIAHVPYASTLMSAKKTITPNTIKSEPSTSTTITQTVKKGVQRVAHIPNEKFIDRPGVLEPLGSKIPANIRSVYLNMMIDECLKMYLTAPDAYARAQHEELNTSKKCSAVQIYKNSAVLAVSRLRKELAECKGVKKSASDCSTLIKVGPGLAPTSTGSWSIVNNNRKIDLSQEFRGARFYNNIKKWILTEEQLKENGFPRPHESGQRGRAIIYGQNKKPPPKGFTRTCCRCKKEYIVDKKGFAVVKEECIYHPNNKYRVRGEVKYQCCSQDGSTDGCCVAPSHVYEYVDFDNLKGFVKTLPPENVMDDYGIYSLDCEMCYTTHGLDLTRVTVINSDCKVIYETLIKPLHPIIDYNTRYSGITEEQMVDVKTTLLEVQATLLTMFNSKSILIGHSLESDFKVLKLIHDTVIDTSVLYPHKMGPPYKRALRNLTSEYLKKIIQNSVEGHDSAEDATVCMELVHYKLKEELKTR
ncbi:RNA exonuclease 1 homolog [Anticarsia gemmatalis]|uniref:RNA exonuclease 1 homolog n=1 Tax=Anticarsia gemmatalis TaxID=129554 RepID=UPI003F759FBD